MCGGTGVAFCFGLVVEHESIAGCDFDGVDLCKERVSCGAGKVRLAHERAVCGADGGKEVRV